MRKRKSENKLVKKIFQILKSSSSGSNKSHESDSDFLSFRRDDIPFKRRSGRFYVGNYRILSEIGHGKFATVVAASDESNDHYAIKLVRWKKSRDEALVTEQYILETTRVNKNRFIVRYHETLQSNNYRCFVLENLNGGSISRHLRFGPLSEDRARFYAACLLSAIAHLHSLNIVHKDVKPQNIILSREGYPKLIDFGHSQIHTSSTTPLKNKLGTRRYKAPEMFEPGPVYRGVDFWAFMVTLHIMLTKKYVTIYPKIQYETSHLSSDAVDLMSRMLRKNPSKRLGYGQNGAWKIMQHPFFKVRDFMQQQLIIASIGKNFNLANWCPPECGRRQYNFLKMPFVGVVNLEDVYYNLL